MKSCLLALVCILTLLPLDQSYAAPDAEIEINLTTAPGDDYLTWAGTPARIRLKAPEPADVTVVLTNDLPTARPDGGDVVFGARPRRKPTAASVSLLLPKDGSWREFVVAGKFGRPSTRDKDAIIEVHQGTRGGPVIGQHALMVRVRKNANNLTPDEQTRFLRALAGVNTAQGRYGDYQRVHTAADNPCFPGHQGAAFLPWHRAFLVQFERELQKVDPSVALHYWKFDVPAERLFTNEYMGANGGTAPQGFEQVTFAPGNPLNGWRVQTFPILRSGSTNHLGVPQLDGAPINTEEETLSLGMVFADFRDMEGNPHGYAHVWIGGWMGNPTTAVRDPIFFLLHSNVERLWAKWQRERNRFTTTAAAYSPQGSYRPQSGARQGHFLRDTMWPWNGLTGPGPCDRMRADDSNRPNFATAPFPSAAPFPFGPPPTPTPADLIDYWGLRTGSTVLGFAYDDVGP